MRRDSNPRGGRRSCRTLNVTDMSSGIAADSVPKETQARVCVSPSRLLRASAAAIGALAPFGYLGILVGVAIHEVIGHGLTSLAVGGDFLGFQLDFDGMGHALIPLESEEAWRHILVLSGGVAATSIFGLALLLGGYIFRRRPWIALPLIVISFGVLMDGIPYVFWNALSPVPPGDLGKVIAMTDNSWLRIVLLVLGGTSMIAVVWGFTALIFAILQSWLTGGEELRSKARLVLLVLLGFIPGIAWFTFDWNQLVPGIGALPNITGLVLHMAASGSLLWIRPRVLHLRSTRGVKPAAFVGWSLAAVSVAVIAIWLRHGVSFIE